MNNNSWYTWYLFIMFNKLAVYGYIVVFIFIAAYYGLIDFKKKYFFVFIVKFDINNIYVTIYNDNYINL